jgi:hypothetical protein
MRREVEDFCDQRLASFEIVLEKVAKTVTAGRERLKATAEPRDEPPAKEATADDGSFFDQDLD